MIFTTSLSSATARDGLYAATNKGLFVSHDGSKTWSEIAFPSQWKYTWRVLLRADGNGPVFLCNGDGPPGSAWKASGEPRLREALAGCQFAIRNPKHRLVRGDASLSRS